MAQTYFTEKRSRKLNVQHVTIFAALVISLFLIFQLKLIPIGISSYVVAYFQPPGDELSKVGFVKYNGLVWATPKERKEGLIDTEVRNMEISKDQINNEYIFDFTWATRNELDHGYVKKSTEFYAKSPILGEKAIILEPWLGFSILALDLAVIITILLTILMPTSIGFISILFDRQIDETKIKIRLQTGFSDEIVELLVMPDDKLREKESHEVERAFRAIWNRTAPEEAGSSRAALTFEDQFSDDVDLVAFRNLALYNRIKEYFSDFVLKEIVDTKDGILWRRNHSQIMKGMRLYMAHHFTEKYSNNVTGLAYGGAAILIVSVGIRGLKFIPASKPSVILAATFLEFTMLSLLAITLIYTEEEERMDKMLKKMEDANLSQLEALRGQQHDIRLLANALVGQTSELVRRRVEDAIADYLSNADNLEKAIGEKVGSMIVKVLRQSSYETSSKH